MILVICSRYDHFSRPPFHAEDQPPPHSRPLQCSGCLKKPEACLASPYEVIGLDIAAGLRNASEDSLPPGAQQQHNPCCDSPSPSSQSEAQASSLHWSLVRWVWAYFSNGGAPSVPAGMRGEGAPSSDRAGSRCAASGGALNSAERMKSRVVRTRLSPLYFQHEGHSRTIIGVERRPDPEAASARDRAQAAKVFKRQGSSTDVITLSLIHI